MGSGDAEGGRKRKGPFSQEIPEWLEIWSFGRYSLGLSEEEFWGLTLAQFNALAERHNKLQGDMNERDDYRTALICSQILNTIPRTSKSKNKVFLPSDIFPDYGWKQEETKPLTQEQLQRKLDGIFNIMGIEKKKKHDNPDKILQHYRILNAALGGTEVEK